MISLIFCLTLSLKSVNHFAHHVPTRRSAEPQVTVGVGVDLSEHEQMEKVGERARKALVRVEKGVLEK